MADTTPSLLAAEKKLFLLDGMALTYRAHFALVRSHALRRVAFAHLPSLVFSTH